MVFRTSVSNEIQVYSSMNYRQRSSNSHFFIKICQKNLHIRMNHAEGFFEGFCRVEKKSLFLDWKV